MSRLIQHNCHNEAVKNNNSIIIEHVGDGTKKKF